MTMQLDTLRIGFVGAGRMATALAEGLIRAGLPAAHIVASDAIESAREAFVATTGAKSVASNVEVMAAADVVFLAVKPQYMVPVLQEVASHVTPNHLIVSIAAGLPIERYTAVLSHNVRFVRVMPNTPCLVGEGASAYSIGGAATVTDGQLVEQLLATVGIALPVPESLLDAVTGLSGSGPAYAYQIIEALSDGGVRVGLPRDVATRLAAQTLLGAARMVLSTGQHPGELKDAVTSPGGTTIAGLHALENGGLRGCLMNAVEAATRRSIELR